MKEESIRRVARGWVLASLLAAPAVPLAAGDPGDIIKYRQNVMKLNGEHAAAAEAIIKAKVEFKDQLLDHARALDAFTRNIPALFPPGSDTGAETRAQEAVWSKRAEFEKKSKDTEAKAAAFAKTVAAKDDGQIQARFKELDESCSACHKDFRKRRRAQ